MKVGLSLAGGGVKGAYQIGAYYAFKKCHIKIDGMVGTSIGSFNAAMLCAGREKELYDLWESANVGKILALEESLVNVLKKKKKTVDEFKILAKEIKKIVQNKGLNTSGLRDVLTYYDIEDDLRKSSKDFGLVTVKLKDLKPVYVFKEDIKEGKLHDYLISSCNLPVFKLEKMIDEAYYIDGGFYDNCPSNMLLDKGYDIVYAIELSAIGIRQKPKEADKVITIRPSRNLGPIFTLDNDLICSNIELGYYDTIKVLKNLDGYKFIFKNKNELYYKYLTRKVNSKILADMEKFFKSKTKEELVIKALEYVMKKEKYEYCEIYDPIKVIRQINKKTKRPTGVYKFISQLKLL